MKGRRKVGRIPIPTICYIVARDKKLEPKVHWHIVI